MKATLLAIYTIALKLGGFGLLIVGVLDSSFLFMPLGNDLLMVGLTANHHGKLLYYAAMATLGSVAGCLIIDWIGRKGGEEGLHKLLSERRIEYVKKKVTQEAGWALALAAIMPPPFPFTPFVVGAAAFQYPRKKLFSILATMRFLRFAGIGLLGIFFGDRILNIAKEPAVEYSIIAIVIISIIGSVASIYKWIQRSRTARGPSGAEAPA